MGITMKNCRVEVSDNGTTWTNVSADAVAVEVDGFELQTEGISTFGSAYMTQTVGGFEMGTVTLRVLYNETANSAWDLATAAYQARSNFYIRWSPRGGQTGQLRFTTDAGYIKSMTWPAGESNASAILVDLVLETPRVQVATIT